jgi:hypothetical protein
MPGKRGSRGGKRQGAPGKAYTNRSDLNQAPRAVPGQEYGTAGAQLASQSAVPMAGPGKTLPQPVPLTAPTGRPGEPLTAGIAGGAGAGPEALLSPGGTAPDDDAEGFLRALHRQYPNSDIARLIAEIDARKR